MRVEASALGRSALILWVFAGPVGSVTVPGFAASGGQPEAQEERRQGHLRMLRELEAIAAASADSNPVVGTRRLRDLRALVTALPGAAPSEQRANLLGALAEQEMIAGSTESAVTHLEAASRALAEIDPGRRAQLQPRIDFLMATALMRLGEERNCVARHTSESCLVPLRPGGVHSDPRAAERAIVLLTRLFKTVPPRSPYHYASRWLLNIAHMTAGSYPAKVPPEALVTFPSSEGFPTFREIGDDLGVASFDLCGGAIADDFDGDGFLDLVASSWDPRGQLRFWRSDGRGSFVERTEAAGLTGLFGGLNLVQGDYDNDGDLDILVLRGAWLDEAGRHPNSLLQNQGDGSFADVTFAAGLGEVHYPTQTAAFADYDNDGDLDLYVGNEARPRTRYPNQLFRNQGDGTFIDVAVAAGVENLRWTKGVAWGDFDGDRLPDLYVSNLHGANRLFHNQGDGTFTDVAPRLGVTLPEDSFAVWFWDYDNDGALDLMVNAYQIGEVDWGSLHLWYVAASHLGEPHPADLPRLYRGNGRGGFADVAPSTGLAQATLPMGANFGDLDNDGFLDLYLGTGYPGLEGLIPNKMYRSRRGEVFLDVTSAGGFGHLQKGHGIAFADLDNDGDEDIYQQVGGFVPADGFANALFQNPGFGQHWLSLELVGVRSNRFGVGARLRLDIVEDGEERSIYRHVGAVSSFGANPLRQHVGVGRAGRIELLEVYWPTSETTQRFRRLEVDRFLRVTEGEEALEQLALPVLVLRP